MKKPLILDHIRPQCDISPGYCLCYIRLWDTKVETGKNYIVDGRTSQSIQPITYTKSPSMTATLFKIYYAPQTWISLCSFICCVYFACITSLIIIHFPYILNCSTALSSCIAVADTHRSYLPLFAAYLLHVCIALNRQQMHRITIRITLKWGLMLPKSHWLLSCISPQ